MYVYRPGLYRHHILGMQLVLRHARAQKMISANLKMTRSKRGQGCGQGHVRHFLKYRSKYCHVFVVEDFTTRPSTTDNKVDNQATDVKVSAAELSRKPLSQVSVRDPRTQNR